MYDRDEYAITEERIRRARRGYYGMISYIDAQLGRILAALEALGQRDDTVIIATADHGDMLGERGLWYKMTFFERAVRVPLIICAPELFGGAARGAGRVAGGSAADAVGDRRTQRARCIAGADRWHELVAADERRRRRTERSTANTWPRARASRSS